MSHSLINADRRTHLKIVAVALACAVTVVAVGVTGARVAARRRERADVRPRTGVEGRQGRDLGLLPCANHSLMRAVRCKRSIKQRRSRTRRSGPGV